MTIQMVRDALLWCTVINYAVLIIWFLLFVLLHQWLVRWWSAWFHVSGENVTAINFAAIALFKIGILLFNLVPYVALRIIV